MHVVFHEAFQMVFVEYDHMIEQFATTAANEPFRNAILPRASEAGPFRLDRNRRGRFPAAAATPMRS
jgi:hypothetical protein